MRKSGYTAAKVRDVGRENIDLSYPAQKDLQFCAYETNHKTSTGLRCICSLVIVVVVISFLVFWNGQSRVNVSSSDKEHDQYNKNNELSRLRNKTIALESSIHILENQIQGLRTSIDVLSRLLKEVDTNWQRALQNTTSTILNNVGSLKNELINKITSDISNVSSAINNVKSELTTTRDKLASELLSKADYEQSVGLLSHEQNVKYDSLHRHRLCLVLATSMTINWGLIVDSYRFLNCDDFYGVDHSTFWPTGNNTW